MAVARSRPDLNGVRVDGAPSASGPSKTKKVKKMHSAASLVEDKNTATDLAQPTLAPPVEENKKPWPWSTLVGSFAIDHAPAFTKDGRYLFVIAGPCVKMYSVSTGQALGTLQPPAVNPILRSSTADGHEDIITAMALHPHNPFQLITGSLDGSLRIWDFLDAKLLQTISVGYPISHICSHEKYKEQVFVAVMTKLKRKKIIDRTSGHTLVLLVSLKGKGEITESSAQKPTEVIRIGKTQVASSLTMSPRGTWLGVVAGPKLYIASTSSLDNGFTKLEAPHKLTSLAIHPNDEYVVTGDEKGQLRFWYCLNDQVSHDSSGSGARTQTSTLHWHAHAVSSVGFTSNGAHLLSGGEEGVLVLWHLLTGKREFVPNLGAAIRNIALRNDGEEEYLVGLLDGGFILVNGSTLSKTRIISHIGIAPIAQQRRGPARVLPLAVHTASSTVILPSSHPSSLQFYRSASWTAISELEVVPSNRISRRDEKPMKPSHVERVATAASGEWMATVDKRDGGDDDLFRSDIHLKIWHWENSAWVLNTRIDQPHGRHAVIALSFSPMPLLRGSWLLVSAGLDGHVKTWRTQGTTAEKQAEGWRGNSTLSFRKAKPSDVAWSPDASIIAVAFGTQAVLYSSTDHALVDTITTLNLKSIEFLRFVGRNGRFLLVADHNEAVLWDLVTRSIRWIYHSPLRIIHAVPHPKNDLVALLLHSFRRDETKHRDTHTLIFGVSSSVPVETRTIPFWLRGLTWYPSQRSQFAFVGITHTWSVVLIGDEALQNQEQQNMVPRTALAGVEERPRRSIFHDLFGDSAFEEMSADPTPAEPQTAFLTNEESAPLFDCATYLAPALQSIYSPLIDKFLHRRSEPRQEPKEDIDMLEEEEASSVYMPSYTNSLPTKKIVDDMELEALVDLFKNHVAVTNSQSLPYL